MKKSFSLVVSISLLTMFGSIAIPQSFCLQEQMGPDCGKNKTYKISEVTFAQSRLEPAVFDDFLLHFNVSGGDKSPVFVGWRYRKEFTAKIVSNKVFQKFGDLYVNMNNVSSISIYKAGGKISFKNYNLEVKKNDLLELRKFAKNQGVSGGKIKGLPKAAGKESGSGKTIMVGR